MATSSAGRSTGSGARSAAFRSVKIVVLAPTPRASDSTATAANPGFLRIVRKAYRASCQSVSMAAAFLPTFDEDRGPRVRNGPTEPFFEHRSLHSWGCRSRDGPIFTRVQHKPPTLNAVAP